MTEAEWIVTCGGEQSRFATPEEVGSALAQYQLEHPEDPDLTGVSVERAGSGEQIPARHFLPQQLP